MVKPAKEPQSADSTVHPRESADKSKAPVIPQTEGQRLLLLVQGSLKTIADAVGARSKQTVLDWRNGRKVPDEGFRRKLEKAYGIPVRSWLLPPEGTDGGDAPVIQAKAPPAASSKPDTTLGETLALIEATKAQLAARGLQPQERAKLNDTLAKLLALRARLERDVEALEDRIVREHPQWARIRATITSALKPYPEAAKAVAEALAGLDSDQEL